MSLHVHWIASRRLNELSVVGLAHEPIRGFADAIRARVMASVMKPAKEQEVVEVGFATKRPVLVVVGFRAIRRHPAAGEAAEAISRMQRQAQPMRRAAAAERGEPPST